MGRLYDELDDRLIEWIGQQHLFFVATAPSGPDGHVNLSPKGHDTFRVLDRSTVAYQDLTGSGIETVAHLRDNGRLTFMFCAFEGPPLILRLYGTGEVVDHEDPRYDELAAVFDARIGARAVIRMRIDRIATSCGYSVPVMTYTEERDKLLRNAERRGREGLLDYRAENNTESIDGLPGLPAAIGRGAPGMG